MTHTNQTQPHRNRAGGTKYSHMQVPRVLSEMGHQGGQGRDTSPRHVDALAPRVWQLPFALALP